MEIAIAILIFALVCNFSARCFLFGVSHWWKVNNTNDEEERVKNTKTATALVSFALGLWAIMVFVFINFQMVNMVIGILQSAGIPIQQIEQ